MPTATAKQPLSAEDDNIQQINDAVNYILEDDIFSPRPGNRIVTSGYRGLPGPQEPGWSELERQEWLYVRDEKQITFEQLVSLSIFLFPSKAAADTRTVDAPPHRVSRPRVGGQPSEYRP